MTVPPARRAALIARARKRFGKIRPCGSRRTLGECFTQHPDGGLVFWFNDISGNTHVERELRGVQLEKNIK